MTREQKSMLMLAVGVGVLVLSLFLPWPSDDTWLVTAIGLSLTVTAVIKICVEIRE